MRHIPTTFALSVTQISLNRFLLPDPHPAEWPSHVTHPGCQQVSRDQCCCKKTKSFFSLEVKMILMILRTEEHRVICRCEHFWSTDTFLIWTFQELESKLVTEAVQVQRCPQVFSGSSGVIWPASRVAGVCSDHEKTQINTIGFPSSICVQAASLLFTSNMFQILSSKHFFTAVQALDSLALMQPQGGTAFLFAGSKPG